MTVSLLKQSSLESFFFFSLCSQIGGLHYASRFSLPHSKRGFLFFHALLFLFPLFCYLFFDEFVPAMFPPSHIERLPEDFFFLLFGRATLFLNPFFLWSAVSSFSHGSFFYTHVCALWARVCSLPFFVPSRICDRFTRLLFAPTFRSLKM